MGRVVPLADSEIEAIEADLRAGMSCGRVAKKHRRGLSTVVRIANGAGIDLDQSRTKKAVEARRDFDQAARVELINDMVTLLRTIMGTVKSAHQMQALSIAAATLIDKRRLEDGEATSRIDDVTSDARDHIARRLDELAERRRARDAAGGAQSEAAS